MKAIEAHLTSYVKRDGIRYVVPYKYEYKTYAKGRWVGRKLLEVLSHEFGSHDNNYWMQSLANGLVKVNGNKFDKDYVVKGKDLISHITHRHEPPIMGDIVFVGETDELFAVSKPPSLPVHPCGSYRFNSLEYILAKEPIIENQPDFHIIHRLDKVTSGLVVMAKSRQIAIRMAKTIQDKKTRKTYLARVRGRFPGNLSHLRVKSVADILASVGSAEDEDDGEGGEQDGGKRKSCDGDKDRGSRKKVQTSSLLDINSSNLDDTTDLKALYACDRVGYAIMPTTKDGNVLKDVKDICDSVDHVNSDENKDVPKLDSLIPSDQNHTNINNSAAYEPISNTSTILLSCPLGILNFRDGTHTWRTDGKTSVSAFTCRGYDEASDTSLIECELFTGRSHQLRLHLQFLGNPIANDPCYGGELFYGDATRKRLGIGMLRYLKKYNIETLTKVSHLQLEDEKMKQASLEGSGEGVEDDLIDEATVEEIMSMSKGIFPSNSKSNSNSESIATEVVASEGLTNSTENVPISAEDELERSIKSTCRFCFQNDMNMEIERLLHCDGIWLHSFRYQGPDWKFQSPYPDWAQPFLANMKISNDNSSSEAKSEVKTDNTESSDGTH